MCVSRIDEGRRRLHRTRPHCAYTNVVRGRTVCVYIILAGHVDPHYNDDDNNILIITIYLYYYICDIIAVLCLARSIHTTRDRSTVEIYYKRLSLPYTRGVYNNNITDYAVVSNYYCYCLLLLILLLLS